MARDFLKPTMVRILLSVSALLLTGLILENPSGGGGKVGDLPLINSLLFYELISLLNAELIHGGLVVLSAHVFLSYLMGCSLTFLFSNKNPLKAGVVVAIGLLLPATLIFALASALFSQIETWDRQSVENSTAPRILSRDPAARRKLSLGLIRVLSPEHTERIKASLRDAGLDKTRWLSFRSRLRS